MRAPAIVDLEVLRERGMRLARGLVGMQVDLLVFDAVPLALDEHVIDPVALAVCLEMCTPCGSSTSVNATAVNSVPWSVLKISGGP